MSSWEKEQQESAYARSMLQRSDEILAAVDNAYIIKERGHRVRAMPTFRPEEISLGKVLGTGGFGIVNEIKGFFLDKEDGQESSQSLSPPDEVDNDNEEKAALLIQNNPQDTTDEATGTTTTTTTGTGTGLRKRSTSEKSLTDRRAITERIKQESNFSLDAHTHYDVSKAKQVMAKQAMKGGRGRYALKRLHTDLSELERIRGMIDLAVEAKYLSTVWHPNIIKMRGMAVGKMVDDDFFIIMDRLQCTLDHRMNEWYQTTKQSRGLCGFGKKKKVLHELLVERMTILYDIAAALFYLHENRIVYRDIKPENIGFDMRGDVKVFDFGLCKNLSSNLKSQGYGYRLTGRAGSLPYMAPEVARMDTYDTKCDVFSFAILLWEIMSLSPAFKGLSPTQFMENVVIGHERLAVPKTWPPLTRLMLPEAWDKDPKNRPDMKRVAILIRGDLNDMTDDDMIVRRTKHMNDRSNHSFEFGLSDPHDQPIS